MRTTQHDLVGTLADHRLQHAAHGFDGFGRLLAVFLDQFDEPFAYGGQHPDILPVTGRRAAEQIAVQTPGRSQHTYHPAAGIQAGGLHGGFHTYDRHLPVFAAQKIDGRSRSRIAGDDDHFATGTDQPSDRLVRQTADLIGRTRTIGTILTVAQIDERLLRQLAADFAPDRQAAQPRIIYADRPVIHFVPSVFQ